MFRVSLTALICIYTSAFLGFIFMIWLRDAWRRRRAESLSIRHRLQCHICALEFEDRNDDLLARCPHCGALNERYRYSTL